MTTRILVALALVAALLGGYFWWESHVEKRGALEERARGEHAAEMQRTANRSRSQDIERAQGARTVYRDRFIDRTIIEVRHAAQNLASCPLTPDTVRLLNAAAECARNDRSAACGPDGAVR